jgi:hypothetical protein
MARTKTTLGTSLGLPADYTAFLESLKARVRQAQTQAMLSVNRELIQLYWDKQIKRNPPSPQNPIPRRKPISN